jgi:hypothetical protein
LMAEVIDASKNLGRPEKPTPFVVSLSNHAFRKEKHSAR